MSSPQLCLPTEQFEHFAVGRYTLSVDVMHEGGGRLTIGQPSLLEAPAIGGEPRTEKQVEWWEIGAVALLAVLALLVIYGVRREMKLETKLREQQDDNEEEFDNDD